MTLRRLSHFFNKVYMIGGINNIELSSIFYEDDDDGRWLKF